MLVSLILAAILVLHVGAFDSPAEDTKCGKSQNPDEHLTTMVCWGSCGQNISQTEYACANISVPLDYHSYGTKDNRTAVIAVTKRLASNPDQKLGSLFVNPGGPGGSGTDFVYGSIGESIDTVLQGRYDLLGFDPRGINLTKPLTECFESLFGYELFAANTFREFFDLPTDLSKFPHVKEDLHRQVSLSSAAFQAAAAQCVEMTGDRLAYMGTEAVVRDIDYMSKVIDGENVRINYWGLSYGTVIGQYMVHILPRERLGRIAIDGVVNVEKWATDPLNAVTKPQISENMDDVVRSFAESCSKAGDACALSHLSPSEILATLDKTIDSLYENPQPVTGLPFPPGVGVATAYQLRALIFRSTYNISTWPDVAAILADTFQGNYTTLLSNDISYTAIPVNPADISAKDNGVLSVYAITCADLDPPSKNYSTAVITDAIFNSLLDTSARNGDTSFRITLCGFWPVASRSRYSGPFTFPRHQNATDATKAEASLDTPILVLSQKYDPVTSLRGAEKVIERLGGANARLVEQNGWGHCTVSQVSFCTLSKLSAFFVNGTLPEADHTYCEVDQHAFEDFTPSSTFTKVPGETRKEVREARKLMEAWKGLGNKLGKRFF